MYGRVVIPPQSSHNGKNPRLRGSGAVGRGSGSGLTALRCWYPRWKPVGGVENNNGGHVIPHMISHPSIFSATDRSESSSGM